MKRVMIPALVVLALALLALAWWAITRTSPRELAPATDLVRETISTPDPPAAVSSTDADAIEAPREGPTRSAATAEAANTASTQSERVGGIPLARVRGLVRDARTLAPIPRGTVSITFSLPDSARGWSPPRRPPPASGSSISTIGEKPDRATTTSVELDAQGRFELALPVDTLVHEVSAAPGDHNGMPATPAEWFVGVPKSLGSAIENSGQKLEPAGIELVLEVSRGFVLTGIVRDADTHLPLPDATLQLRSGLGAADSGADGSFVLGARFTRTTLHDTLDVTQREHLPARLELGPDELAANAPLVIEMRRGLVVSGRVVDESGHELTEVMLSLATSGGVSASAPSASLFSARSSAEGEFRFGPIAPCRMATITVTPQEHGGAPLFGLEQALGPLERDCAGLELRLAIAGTISVRVELASGGVLAPSAVHLFAPGAPEIVPGRIEPGDQSRRVQVPLGREFEIVALARASNDAQEALLLRGSQRVFLDRASAEPPLVRIVLLSSASFDLPPPPEGARMLALDSDGPLLGAFDVQLVEAGSGRALREGRHVSVAGEGASLSTSKLVDGWLRIRASPGRHRFEIELDGGPRTSVECTIPLGGYARGEWSVEAGP